MLDKFHYHEALDRCYLVAHIFETHVEDHQAVEQNPELQALAQKAQSAMQDLYQAIGRAGHRAFPE